MPMVISSDDKVSTLYSHDYGNGLKLMEHSYIGNNFVNAVASLIWETPKRVAWIGDYSDDYVGDPYEEKMDMDLFKTYYRMAWKEGHPFKVQPDAHQHDMAEWGLFLVNHSQQTYIDLDEFVSCNCPNNDGEPWIINPLPLLTACGNGRGGGDYHDSRPDYDIVGTWAFDKIEITHIRPDYEPVMYSFREDN